MKKNEMEILLTIDKIENEIAINEERIIIIKKEMKKDKIIFNICFWTFVFIQIVSILTLIIIKYGG